MNLKETIKKFIPEFLLNFYHFLWTFFGALIYSFPGKSNKIKIIGITGTSGKSTTTDFISRILEEPFDSTRGRSVNKVASISSIRFKLGDKEWVNKYKMTMPGRFVIQRFLRQAIKENCNFVVLEITSEGLRQNRHKFINFDLAVFTNLSKEHIESHGSFENYRKEKLKLFKATKNAHIINQDDANSKYFWDIEAKQKIGFHQNDASFQLNLQGKFNSYNASSAIAVAKFYGIDIETCKKALEKVKNIPGRMEVVSLGHSPTGEAENPKVIVDYAHTPEQLEQVYKSFPDSNLICVLGSCGGGRDKWKRPILGEIAEKYCKYIFITDEDPYDEDPRQILSEIKSGISNPEFLISNVQEILDRKEAIKEAIKSANKTDVVIITGKGSEPLMCVKNGKKISWDDREIARSALRK